LKNSKVNTCVYSDLVQELIHLYRLIQVHSRHQFLPLEQLNHLHLHPFAYVAHYVEIEAFI